MKTHVDLEGRDILMNKIESKIELKEGQDFD